MPRKTATWLAWPLFFLFSSACATSGLRHPGPFADPPSARYYEARSFPEVRLSTVSGGVHTGKILALDADRIRFLPSPYWGVEVEELDVDALASVTLARPPGGGWHRVLAAFGYGFLIPGAVLVALSQYDEDYAGSLLVASGTAFISGVISYLGANRKAGWRKPFDVAGMTVPQKKKVIIDVMHYGI